MTSLPERVVHLCRGATLALLLALLAACGPGTGGTGTGPIGFASELAAGVSGSIPAPGLPCSSCTRIELRLDEELVELRLPCARFVSAGRWDPDATELALAGTIEFAGTSAPATLRLQFGSEGSRSAQVVVTLVDAGGQRLATATLQRSASVLPAACP